MSPDNAKTRGCKTCAFANMNLASHELARLAANGRRQCCRITPVLLIRLK
jgi:hypothetical protein